MLTCKGSVIRDNIIVPVDKMDLARWDEESFDSLKKELKSFLKSSEFSVTLVHFISYSEEHGLNIITIHGTMNNFFLDV